MSGHDDPSRHTWPELVHEFRLKLGLDEGADPETTPTPTSEDEYRKALRTLCSANRERDEQRLFARIRRQHATVLSFVTRIDTTQATLGLPEAFALQPLIWQLLTCAVKACFVAKKQLASLIEETNKLNSQLPPSLRSDELVCYPYDPKVQEPLQEIFREYLDCYLSMFSEFATYPRGLCLAQYEERIKSASEYLLPRAERWQSAVQDAREQERLWKQTNSIAGGQLAHHPAGPTPTSGTHVQFRHVRDLGRGTYGDVSEVMEVTTKTLYAQKLIRIRDPPHGTRGGAQDAMEQKVRSEYSIMKKLRHHHVAEVLFYVKDVTAFRLIMHPVANYDLKHFLEIECVDARFPRDEVRHLDSWFGCLASALTFAHEQSVKHEDIKPSNILIKDHRPYLSDFGSAKDFSGEEGGSSISSDKLVAGTPVYWCPEGVANRGRSADIFSLGCVFSEMLTVRQGRSLQNYRLERSVEDTDFPCAYRKNLPGVNRWLENLPGMEERGAVQGLLLKVVDRMMKREPKERLTAREVRNRFRAEDRLFCSTCS